jgi:beta-1,4-N-acetylglucosaminyltransferase
VYGRLEDLAGALREAEELRVRMKTWPPVNSGVHRQAKGLKGVMDEEMGFLD